MLVMSESRAHELVLSRAPACVRWRSLVVTHRFGLRPGSGLEAGTEKSGAFCRDIGVFEMNEAFAAQILPCIKIWD